MDWSHHPEKPFLKSMNKKQSWLQASVPLRLAITSPTTTVPQPSWRAWLFTQVSKACLCCKSSWCCMPIWCWFSVPCWCIVASFQIQYSAEGMLSDSPFTWSHSLWVYVLRPNKSTCDKQTTNNTWSGAAFTSGWATKGIKEVKTDEQVEMMLDEYLDFW